MWEVECGRCSVGDSLLSTRNKMFRCSGYGYIGCSAYVCRGSPAARIRFCAEAAQFSTCGIPLLDAHELALELLSALVVISWVFQLLRAPSWTKWSIVILVTDWVYYSVGSQIGSWRLKRGHGKR